MCSLPNFTDHVFRRIRRVEMKTYAPIFLSLHSNQACPPKKMDGSVMDGRTKSMCIMLQDVFGRNRRWKKEV